MQRVYQGSIWCASIPDGEGLEPDNLMFLTHADTFRVVLARGDEIVGRSTPGRSAELGFWGRLLRRSTAADTAMPTEAISKMTAKHAVAGCEFAMIIDTDDDEDDEVSQMMFLQSAEPFARRILQDIGPEKLSLERLQREEAARGREAGDSSRNIYSRFGFHLDDLPTVVEALAPPVGFKTKCGVFDGEEGVLLLLRRFRSTDGLLDLTMECGRSISAISQAVGFMVEHVHARFPYLIDERSFCAWAPRFVVAPWPGRVCGFLSPRPSLGSFLSACGGDFLALAVANI